MTTYTLYRLPNEAGFAVVSHDESGITGGQAGFSQVEVDLALSLYDAGDPVYLSDWMHLEITKASAEFVAASYPAIMQES